MTEAATATGDKMMGAEPAIQSPLQGETNSYTSPRDMDDDDWPEHNSSNHKNSNSVRVLPAQTMQSVDGEAKRHDEQNNPNNNDDNHNSTKTTITTSFASSCCSESTDGEDTHSLAKEDARVKDQDEDENENDYPENEILEYWNTSFILSTIASHIPEKQVFDEEPATPTFFPTRHHHHFFPDTAEVLEDEDFAVGSPNASDSRSSDLRDRSQTDADAGTLVTKKMKGEREEMEEAELLEEKKAKAAKKLGHTTSESGEKATPNVKSPALSQGAHRIRVVDSVAYPPKDAVTTTQKNLIFWGKSLPLYSIIDVPHWQRYNPAIRGSYRAFYNTSMTIKSFLGWHNETLNIWTHFVGFLLFLYLTYFLCTRTLQWGGSFSSYLNSAPIFYYLFCLGCMACTICSTIYHLFTGHCNCKLMVLMGRIDFVGITFLIIGSFLPPLYVLLHCFPMIRNIYLTASIVLGAATSFACWTDTFFEHVGLRVGLFVGLAVSGVGPLIHLLFMVPFSDTMASIVYGILLMLALYGSGVVFYVTRFPEAWFPAHFDCFLSSHQIWHYFVMMAAIVHFFNCTSIYQMYTMSDGNC